MARKRMIDPNFWTDEKLGTCEPLARYTFMGLISQADDAGRLNGHPALIKSQVFPYDSDIMPDQVNGWLNQLEQKGLIRRYEVDGQSYICIPKFLKHQKINRPSESKLPAPPENFSDGSVSPHGTLTEPSPRKEEKRKEEKRTTTEQIDVDDESKDQDPVAEALQKIEHHYITRRGIGLIPKPTDMESMQSLINDGFTVEEIIEGIDYAFDNYKPQHSRDGIKSFKYCETIIRSLRAKKEAASKGRVRSGAQKRGQKDDGWDDLPRAVREQMEREARGEDYESEEDPKLKAEIMEELYRMRQRFEEKRAGGQ